MNENNSANEQPIETEEFRLPQKSLNEKVKDVYGYAYRSSVLCLIIRYVPLSLLYLMLAIFLEILRYTRTHMSISTTAALLSIEPIHLIISELLFLIFLPTLIFALVIRNMDKEETNNISNKGEELE